MSALLAPKQIHMWDDDLFAFCENMSVVYQGHGSNVAWKYDWDAQPGEKALQDIKERRGQERRLQEIQQQLEILGQGQEMTVSSKQLHSFTHTFKSSSNLHKNLHPHALFVVHNTT